MTSPDSRSDMPTVTNTSGRAFPSHPRVDRYFAATSIEECRNRLMRCVERGDGPAIVVGSPGIGKTMLLSVLAEMLEEKFTVVKIASTQLCTRRALLQAILHGLGLPYQDREEGELRLALSTSLQDTSLCPHAAVLLVDEAQALPVRLLEELRILSNLAREGEPLLRLVLAGSAALEEQFASTELETFNQRLSARCYLSPLNYGETLQYVRAHVAAVGASPDDLFGERALDSVYSASDGVPRLINQVCDRAIIMAVEQGAAAIDEQLVQAAWSDLHQLPAPWHTPEASLPTPESNVVEFGVLAASDDDHQAIEQLTDDSPAIEPVSTFGLIETGTPEVEPSEVSAPADIDQWDAGQTLADILPAAPVVNSEQATEDYQIAEPASDGFTEIDVSEEIEATPDSESLFGDGFDEEEIVIDRFASIESAFSATTPKVVNVEDTSFSSLVEELAPVLDVGQEDFELETLLPATAEIAADLCEATASDSLPYAEHHSEPVDTVSVFPISGDVAGGSAGSVLSATQVSEAGDFNFGTASDSPFDSHELNATPPEVIDTDVLIIEPDPTPVVDPTSQVQRQEYRQLFAKLRDS